MAQGTPIWDAAGQLPNEQHSDAKSILSVHSQLANKSKNFTTKYKQFVIDYAIEWEKVVRTRVDNGIKNAEQQRRDLDHYSKKVEEIRNSLNRQMNKGKQVKSEQQEKLKRNEEKLVIAKDNYNRTANQLQILIEEVTDRSWRDLHPLLVKIAQFDMSVSQDETKVLSELNIVVAKLRGIAEAQNIAEKPRLKDLAEMAPHKLSTRPGGVSEHSGTTPAITMGSAQSNDSYAPGGSNMSAMSNTYGSDMAAPPGTVTPQGMGGFPVQVADSSPAPVHDPFGIHSPTHANYNTGTINEEGDDPYLPSTLNMLTIGNSSAPAPTMDDIYEANDDSTAGGPMGGGDNASVYSSLSNTISGPPSVGPMGGGGYGRSNSYMHSNSGDDLGSVHSGAFSAPPSMELPPAPPMPPPPPPSMPTYPPPSSYPPPAADPSTNPFGYGPPPPAPAPTGLDPASNPFGYGPPSAPPPMPPSNPPPPPAHDYNPTNPFG